MASPRRNFVGILLASMLMCIVSAADDKNRILYPDVANLTFHYLDTVDVAFTTNYDTPWIYLWCLDSAGTRQQIIFYSPSDVANKKTLSVQLQSNTQYTGSTCWFNLVPNQPESSDADLGVVSPNFDYVKVEDGSKTFSLESVSSATASVTKSTSEETSATSTAVTESTESSAPVETATSGGDEGISIGAKAGIGVVVGLVGIAIIAAAALLLLRRRRVVVASTLNSSSSKPPAVSDSEVAELPENLAPQELAGSKPGLRLNRVAHELPAYREE